MQEIQKNDYLSKSHPQFQDPTKNTKNKESDSTLKNPTYWGIIVVYHDTQTIIADWYQKSCYN